MDTGYNSDVLKRKGGGRRRGIVNEGMAGQGWGGGLRAGGWGVPPLQRSDSKGGLGIGIKL